MKIEGHASHEHTTILLLFSKYITRVSVHFHKAETK